MLSPHESLVLSEETGRLVAVFGNPGTNVGHRRRLRRGRRTAATPRLISSLPVGLLGHESGLSPDGNTFYSASPGHLDGPGGRAREPPGHDARCGRASASTRRTACRSATTATASTSPGSTACTSSTCPRCRSGCPFPEVTEVAHLTWDTMSIPQNALPVTIDGTPYLIEIDEYGAGDQGGRRPHHRHLRRDEADHRLEPAARGARARALRRDRRRPERHEPAPGLRRPLLRGARSATTPASSRAR